MRGRSCPHKEKTGCLQGGAYKSSASTDRGPSLDPTSDSDEVNRSAQTSPDLDLPSLAPPPPPTGCVSLPKKTTQKKIPASVRRAEEQTKPHICTPSAPCCLNLDRFSHLLYLRTTLLVPRVSCCMQSTRWHQLSGTRDAPPPGRVQHEATRSSKIDHSPTS